MSDSKHTPGPWKVHKGVSNYYMITSCDDVEISECGGDFTMRDHQANANLIAAAPELLESCETMITLLENKFEPSAVSIENSGWREGGYLREQCAKMRSAIAKAKGE